MLYELRIYDCNPGMLPTLNKRFNDHTVKLFEKHGIKNIGYWTTEVGESNQRLTYLVAFEDAQHRMDAWESFRNDPEWAEVVEESQRDGIILRNVSNELLVPTPYSPLQ